MERSRSPASRSTGTAGRSRATGAGRRTGGHGRHWATNPLPVAVAASKGAVDRGRAPRAARARASGAPRRATGRSTGHGKRDSAHSVAACRPWLRTLAGRALGPADGRDERPQGRRVADPGRVERLRHAGEARRLDRQGGEDVVELDAEAVAPDDDGEVGSRVARAAARPADGAQHAAGGAQRRGARRRDARVGHDGVQDQAPGLARVGQRVALGDERAVGRAQQRQPRRAQRAAQVVEVGDGVGGREVRAAGAEAARAGPHGARRAGP